MENRYKRDNNVYNIGYHLIWCPKYRRKILKNEIEENLKNFLLEKATQLGLEIVNLEIMPDHVHLFLKSSPNISISKIVNELKGFSSRKLRQKFSNLKKHIHFWSPSYYCETIGHISEKTIVKYINEQKSK